MNFDPRDDATVPDLDDPAEMERQAAVDELRIVDTPPEDRFDVIVKLARQMYGAEAAAFTILDKGRVWHKAKIGTDIDEADRRNSFCSIAIKGEGVMLVPDARLDPRLETNPFVQANPGIRFYAGAPVIAPNGQPLGTLCVWDSQPHDAETFDDTAIKQLTHAIEVELEFEPMAKAEKDRNSRKSTRH